MGSRYALIGYGSGPSKRAHRRMRRRGLCRLIAADLDLGADHLAQDRLGGKEHDQVVRLADLSVDFGCPVLADAQLLVDEDQVTGGGQRGDDLVGQRAVGFDVARSSGRPAQSSAPCPPNGLPSCPLKRALEADDRCHWLDAVVIQWKEHRAGEQPRAADADLGADGAQQLVDGPRDLEKDLSISRRSAVENSIPAEFLTTRPMMSPAMVMRAVAAISTPAV